MSAMLELTSAAFVVRRWSVQAIIGTAVLLIAALLALLTPWIASPTAQLIDLDHRLAAPLASGVMFGTDQLGRNLGTRLILGLRWSFATALCATFIAFAVGTVLGLIAGRSRSWIAKLIQQLTALAQAFPMFVFAVSVVAIAGNGFAAVSIVLGLVSWPVFCRVVQAETASLSAREYVLAAQMLHMSRARFYGRHLLPGLVSSLSVLVPFHFADMLIAESALSFLGVGAPLGEATWGSMLQESRSYLWSAPWLMLLPAGAIVTLVIAANLLGDGLRHEVA